MTTTNYISTDYNGDYFSFCYDLFDMISDDNVQLVLDISSDCWDDLPRNFFSSLKYFLKLIFYLFTFVFYLFFITIKLLKIIFSIE